MNPKLKKTYRDSIRDMFYRIHIHPWYQKMMLLPFWIRATIALFLFVFGVIGLLTPIPAGWMMILTSCVLVFGLHIVKRHSMRLFFLLRLHRVIEWVKYKWKK